jgi:hypothetical protein
MRGGWGGGNSDEGTDTVILSYYFCLIIEGSRSGSIPLTSGSRSGSIPLTMDLDLGGPKTCGSGGSGFGSGTH